MFTEFVRNGCPALIAAACLSILPAGQALAQSTTILLVDDDANPGGNGQTWATAYKHLDDAIASAANPSDVNRYEIWVAAGVYRPDPDLTTPHLRNLSFTLKNYVAILGGFIGSEPLTTAGKNQRNPLVNISRLSGDLANNDNPNDPTTYLDNSYHVVFGSALNDKASIDGFTISDGDNITLNIGENETVPNPNPNVLPDPQSGAGMLLLGGTNQEPGNVVKPGVTRIIFENNRAKLGGGLYLIGAQQSNPQVANCTFRFNFAQADGGGFVCARTLNASNAPAPKVLNCLFHDNRAEGTLSDPGEGGAAFNDGWGTVSFVNCTITQNTAGHGGFGGLFNDNDCGGIGKTGQLTIRNTIVWNNGGDELKGSNSVAYSIIQSSNGICTSGSGNLTGDPSFANASQDNFRLTASSPAIDAGLNGDITTYSDSYDIDQDGNTQDVLPDRDGLIRVADGIGGGECDTEVDMGAYEFGSDYCAGDIDANGAVNVDDLLAVINGWGNCVPAQTCNADIAPGTPCGNGVVDVDDLLLVINLWGCCPGNPGCASANDSIPENFQDCMNYCNNAQDFGACMDDCLESLCKQGYTEYCDE